MITASVMKGLRRVSDNFTISNYSRSDPVNNTIRKFGNYPSVKKISATITKHQLFISQALIKPM